MIRRELHDQFVLITQHDHALLSGVLAGHVGNAVFARPEPREATLRGIAMHDCGWALHDDEPTLNPRRRPLDVFETPRQIALRVWDASVERATAENAYAGLLVSLHVLSLSKLLMDMRPSPRDQFEINKFQHSEIERQEALRRRVGLRIDQPLNMGLAPHGMSAEEDQLTFNFRLLQAMDRVSLALCCTNEPFRRIDIMLAHPAARSPVSVELRKQGETGLVVDPWPFDADELRASVPCRRLPAREYADDQDLRAAFAAAKVEALDFTLRQKQEQPTS